MRELHAPCARCAKFRYMCFHGHCFPPLPSSKAPGYGTVGCVGVLVTKSYPCPPMLVRCSVLNGLLSPSLDLSCLCPGSPLVHMSSTIARVRVIKYQQLCWVLHCSPGTFCRSNMKLVAKKLSMRPLHIQIRSPWTLGPIGSIRLESKICWDTRRKRQQQTTTITQTTAKTQQEVTKIPVQGRKKHQVSSKGLWQPSTHIWEHLPKWFVVGLSTG